jgi:dipeptidyl aminopeptidase/acylaminoacyl peptidase
MWFDTERPDLGYRVAFSVIEWYFRRESGAASDAEFEEMLRIASPMSYVESLRAPVLLIHGDDDRNVDFSQSVDLLQRLRAQKVYFEELIYPDEIHDFLMWKNWIKAYRTTEEFFGKQLNNK